MIVSGYEYNLLKYPAPEADILIQISAEGVIRNQIRRIVVYPYPITAQKPYPDNPWLPHTGMPDQSPDSRPRTEVAVLPHLGGALGSLNHCACVPHSES